MGKSDGKSVGVRVKCDMVRVLACSVMSGSVM